MYSYGMCLVNTDFYYHVKKLLVFDEVRCESFIILRVRLCKIISTWNNPTEI